jgi:outer membrane biosynthesis protein TonB
MQRATLLSAAAHVLVVAAFLGYAWLQPSSPATATFELVSAEPARFGPPVPKAPEPPAETPPEPEPPAPEPEAPALAPKPKDPKAAPKPEPKKPSRDSAVRVAPAAPSAPTGSGKTGDSPVQITNSGDPGLGRWGARVKPLVQRHWNPTPGYDVDLPAMTVLSFNVSVDEGVISNIKVVQSSGNAQLDEEGVRALKRQERLPVPRNFVSPGFSEDILQVRYEFIYKDL